MKKSFPKKRQLNLGDPVNFRHGPSYLVITEDFEDCVLVLVTRYRLAKVVVWPLLDSVSVLRGLGERPLLLSLLASE